MAGRPELALASETDKNPFTSPAEEASSMAREAAPLTEAEAHLYELLDRYCAQNPAGHTAVDSA
jgi:hypothetical protein